MYNKCNETKFCKFKDGKGKCKVLASTIDFVDDECPFFAPFERDTEKDKQRVYKREKFCKIYCKHYVASVEWNNSKELKGKCSICPLANGLKIQ